MPNPCTLRQASLVILSLVFPSLANAQQAPAGQSVGIVTAIQGQAAVSRVSLPQPEPLHFKDDVFFRDQIATRERSTVRLLLGGKGTLTIREQSQVTLDESVSPDGARQSVISILTGKIAAAIAHALMRPGDVIEIRTPNAVAAVRGTVLVAEYIPPQGSAATDRPTLLASTAPGQLVAQAAGVGGTSNFLVISGQITITLQGLPPVTLDTLQSVSITETAAGLQTGPIQNVTPAQAVNQVKDLQVGRPTIEDAGSSQAGRAQAQIAAAVANVIIQSTTGQAVAATTPVTVTTSTASTTTTTATSVTPPPTAPQSPISTQTSSAVSSGSGAPPNGSLLTLSNVNLTLADGISLATFSGGPPNTTILPVPSGEIVGTPLLTVTGNPIAHSGTIVTVDPSTLNGATGPTDAPLVAVNGTTLTNSAGAIFDVSNSVVSAFWPVLQLAPGANATLAGVMNIAEGSEVRVGPHDAVSLQSGSTLTSTDALFQIGGNSVLLTTGEAALVALDPGTLILRAPILSATGNSGIVLLGPAFHAVDSTVTSTQPLVLLQGTSTFASTGPLVLMNGGSLTADSILRAAGSPTILLGVALLEGVPITLQETAVTNTNPSGGALLDLTHASAVFRTLRDTGRAALNYSLNTGQPVVRLTESSLTLTGEGEPVVLLDSSLNAPNGVSLIATASAPGGGTITTQGSLLQIPQGDTAISLTDPNPQIQLTNMTVTQNGSDSLIQVDTGMPVTANSPLLSATSSAISIAGSLLLVSGQLSSNATQPLIQLDPSNVTAAASIVQISGGQLNLAGPLLEVTNSTMSSGAGAASVSVNTGGKLIGSDASGSALLNVSGSTVNAGANFFQVRDSGSQVTLAGPLVADNGSRFKIINNFLRIAGGGGVSSTSPNPLISFSGTAFTGGQGTGTDTGGSILNMRTDAGDTSANTLTLAGQLLKATNTAVNSTDSNLINFRDNAILTSTTTAPLVELTSSTVTANNNIVRVGPYATNDAGTTILGNGVSPSITLAGPAFKATDTNFTAQTGSFLTIRDFVNGTLTGTTPFIQLAGTTSGGTTVTASQGNFLTLASANNQPPKFSLPSSLLNATNTIFATGDPAQNDHTFLFVGDGAKLSSSSADALVRLSGSQLTTAGNFLSVRRSGTGASTVNLSGPLLFASKSSFSTFNSVTAGGCCSFLFVGEGGKLQGTGSDALLQFTTSAFPNIGGSFVNLAPTANLSDSTPAPSTMTLAGSLVNDSGSTLTIAGSLLRVVDGSTLTSTTTLPLLQFSGSTINADSLLFLRGRGDTAHLDSSGLGTDVPLTTGGTVLELDPTTVTLNGTGNTIRVDTATLNALGPIINMINSSLTTSPTGNGLMNMFQSRVTSVEVVKLDASVLKVQNGPLLSVTGGSQMTVNGDFATLLNGSQITVLNGPLISVSGASSSLNVAGGLVNFGNTGGNQIIVKNDLSITGSVGGPSQNLFPVNINGTGSSVTIGPNPVKGDPGKVGNAITATSRSGIPGTGVLFQAAGGGRVTIKAP